MMAKQVLLGMVTDVIEKINKPKMRIITNVAYEKLNKK